MDYRASRVFAARSAELLLLGALFSAACAGSRTRASAAGGVGALSTLPAPCPSIHVTAAQARSLIDKYCVPCHSPSGSAGEEADFRGDAAVGARRANIAAKLRLRAMPPPTAPQPSETERAALRCWADP